MLTLSLYQHRCSNVANASTSAVWMVCGSTLTLASFILVVLWPVAQLYGQVRTDWNQCFVIDCSLTIRLGTNRSHVHTAFYVTRDSIFAPFVECVFLLAFLCMYLRSRGTLLDLFVSSAVSELSSAWSINCFLRYVCCCFVVKDKSLSVLMVDRCCRFASLKPVQNSRQ